MRFVPAFILAAFPFAAAAQVAPNANTVPTLPQPQPRTAPTLTGPPRDPAQTTAALMKSSGGSLLRATLAAQTDPSAVRTSQVSFFAVAPPIPRVYKKHDLVNLLVRQESESKSEGTTDLKKQADLDAKIDQFIKLSLANTSLTNAVGQSTPEIKMEGTHNMKGEATVDRSDSLILRVEAEVIDVKPNNTLVLQARSGVKTDEETQAVILSGICRAEDITPDNTVLSTQLYDISVSKEHTGAVRDTTKRGWVPRLLDVLNPF